jgi:cation diffusion facilitator CzcD-associated flavoprotein CzcO
MPGNLNAVPSEEPDGMHEVAIIGAGFAGLCMAARLKEAGRHDFVVLERGTRVGGTWRDNTYPGCACDVPSHLYSYSFATNGDWSRVFAPWHEIEAYLEDCVRRLGLGPHLRFGCGVTELRYDAADRCWQLTLTDGRALRARVVVSGTGPLNKPDTPSLPGLADFAGHVFHSSQWDHAWPLAGKRVAVIGTGASAIQIVPSIAAGVARLHVFQRTAPWVMPRFDRAYRGWERRLLRAVPGWRRLVRAAVYWRLELFACALLRDGRARRFFERIGRWHLRRQVADPALRAQLAPDYRLGCKRVLLSDDYYPSLQRPNVELVTSPIATVTPAGIRTADGQERALDAIVFATGFRATDFLTPMRVFGADGAELSAQWRAGGAASHLGIEVAGFPNFFLLVGPNTGLGHNSIVFMIEAQVRYVLQCLEAMRRRNARSIVVTRGAQAAFTEEVQRRLQGTAWLAGCHSWYLSADGQNYTMWPGFTVEYWRRTRRPDPALHEFR